MSHVHVKINFSFGIDSWNRCLSVHKRLQIRALLGVTQGVTKRCRLLWLTNFVLVYEPIWGGGGGGGLGQ
jgi:hypothetical protein